MSTMRASQTKMENKGSDSRISHAAYHVISLWLDLYTQQHAYNMYKHGSGQSL